MELAAAGLETVNLETSRQYFLGVFTPIRRRTLETCLRVMQHALFLCCEGVDRGSWSAPRRARVLVAAGNAAFGDRSLVPPSEEEERAVILGYYLTTDGLSEPEFFAIFVDSVFEDNSLSSARRSTILPLRNAVRSTRLPRGDRDARRRPSAIILAEVAAAVPVAPLAACAAPATGTRRQETEADFPSERTCHLQPKRATGSL